MPTFFALIAQSVEHAAVNRSVTGSSPVWGAKKIKVCFGSPLFFIQSEGLVCNRRQAYVFTHSVYGITVGVFSFGLITYRNKFRITYIFLRK